MPSLLCLGSFLRSAAVAAARLSDPTTTMRTISLTLGVVCIPLHSAMFNATTDTDKQVGAKTLAKNYAIAHDALLAFIGRKKHLSRPLLPTKEP